MAKSIEVHSVNLVPNQEGGWTVSSDGLIDNRDYTELELEEEIQRLMADGWQLVGNVKHKPSQPHPQQRDLYFKRETLDKDL